MNTATKQWHQLSDRAKLKSWAAHIGTSDDGSPGPALHGMLKSHDELLDALRIIANDYTTDAERKAIARAAIAKAES